MPTISFRERPSTSRKSRPTWELVELFPDQGHWTEEEYLHLVNDRVRAEWVNGTLELLTMPTIPHDRTVKFLFLALHAFVEARKLGEVFISTTKTKLGESEIRMPDVLLILNERIGKHTVDYFLGADLVMEIVSGDSKSRKRDLVEKRSHYASAGIAEYWIVDPNRSKITVLSLEGQKYRTAGEYKKGQRAVSALLKGFEVDVSEALAGMKR
ncbi:MAG TPA: Uma2 family endonuclease [Planctomycetota bacterium]|nr:Uma2 family endonuclease [Planctomycetota bacterium]